MATSPAYKRQGRPTEAPNATEGQRAKIDHARAIADKIIEQLEAGTSPFQRPWKAGVEPPPGLGMPYNAVSGKGYHGSNIMTLLAEQQRRGFKDDRWLTYAQAQAVGGQVRKGEVGTTIISFNFIEVQDEGKTGGPEGQGEVQRKGFARYPRVFNGDQIEGMPPVKVCAMKNEIERHEACEKLVADYPVPVHYDGRDEAYYHPGLDSIHLPPREAFRSMDGLYATLLHEIGHSTGHPSRLNRDMKGHFGTPSYAREELVAEISSLWIGQRLQIGHDIGQNAAYIKSWIRLLKDEPDAILKACSEAEKVCTFLNIPQYEREKLPLVERERLSTEEKKARWQAQEKAKEPEQTQAPAQVSSPQPEAPSTPQPVKPAARKRTRTRQQDRGMSL